MVVMIFPIYTAEMILHESWGAAELLVVELLILLNCFIMIEHEILQLQLHSSISPPSEICVISKERKRRLDVLLFLDHRPVLPITEFVPLGIFAFSCKQVFVSFCFVFSSATCFICTLEYVQEEALVMK